jgi:hypothetical protein
MTVRATLIKPIGKNKTAHELPRPLSISPPGRCCAGVAARVVIELTRLARMYPKNSSNNISVTTHTTALEEDSTYI